VVESVGLGEKVRKSVIGGEGSLDTFTYRSTCNAIPERGFSVNNAMLGKEKLALAENTVVAQRVVKDCV